MLHLVRFGDSSHDGGRRARDGRAVPGPARRWHDPRPPRAPPSWAAAATAGFCFLATGPAAEDDDDNDNDDDEVFEDTAAAKDGAPLT